MLDAALKVADVLQFEKNSARIEPDPVIKAAELSPAPKVMTPLLPAGEEVRFWPSKVQETKAFSGVQVELVELGVRG